MIVTLHVATGAVAGAATRSRLAAVALGPVLHLAGDVVPHEDIPSRRFETVSGISALLLLALRFGPLDPVTLGAASAAAPDLEHVVPWLRIGGRPLFPSHRFAMPEREHKLPVWTQLLLAGVLLGALLDRGPRPTR